MKLLVPLSLLLFCLSCSDEDAASGETSCEEGSSQECKSDGALGLQYCNNNKWSDCMMPSEECNGLDDDGDGLIDENLLRPCSTACGTGQEECINGVWSNCTALQPIPEICDGLDNDCDGQIDNDIEARACDLGCGPGTEICIYGRWTSCDAPKPSPEICDGIDNDCDGQIDEDLVKDCSTTCGSGVQTCSHGLWSSCSARTPAETENCADGNEDPNGIDDDCNGLIDDGCGDCVNGTSVDCSVSIGECQQGQMLCENGVWGDCLFESEPVIEPGQNIEICDNLDNDCDGATDETFPGQGEPCGTDLGTCEAGIRACENGVEICLGEVKPSVEICDGLDNNCDGEIDNGIDPDSNEPNETCLQSKLIGTLPEVDAGTSPTWITGNTIYPQGDVDVYTVITTEASNFCWPGSDEDAIAIWAYLSNIPEGVHYELCIRYGENENSLEKYCSGSFGNEYCSSTPDADGRISVGYTLSNKCGTDSDSRTMITVRPLSARDFSCQPYTLGVISYTQVD